MPSVYRETYKRLVNGKLVTRKYRCWTIKYKDESGKWRRVKGFTDRAASEAHARKLETKAARLAVGLDDPFEGHLVSPLAEHVAAFKRHMEAKEDSPGHVKQTKSRLDKVIEHYGWKRIGDISASQITEYLKVQREAKAIGKRTSNKYLTAWKSFCKWLDNDGRAPHNPLRHIKQLNTEDERLARDRRALTAAQFAKLIEAARKSKNRRQLSGPDRAVLYMVAAHTGFRAQECASLTPESFDLAEPSVTCEAGYSKRKRKDVQPLRKDLAKFLKAWLKPRTASQRVWPGQWYGRAAEMLKDDLEAAGLPYVDDKGQTFDFHALRHTYITSLHKGGTYGKVLQSLARHSTPVLTSRYTKVDLSDVTAALGGLPALPSDHQYDQGLAVSGKNRQPPAKPARRKRRA